MDVGDTSASGWYLFDGRDRLGPMTAGQLRTALLQLRNPRRGLVWTEALPAWTEAGALPELASLLPAAPPAPVLLRSFQPAGASESGQPGETVDEIEATVTLYRRLVLLVGALLLSAFGVVFIAAMLPPGLADLITAGGQMVVLGLWVVMAVMVYRLAARIDVDLPLLWAMATCIPVVNLVVLALLSRQAQAWCTRRGVVVGFLGPLKGSLDWMR